MGTNIAGFTKSNNQIRREIVNTFEGKGWAYYDIYLTILSHRNANDIYTWPSVETIADETKFSKRYVLEAIKMLEEYDYLGIISYVYKGKTKNKYYFPKEDFFDELTYQQDGGKHRTHSKN